MQPSATTSGGGAFVVSVDLELYWGVHDVARLDDHREALLRVRELAPRLLRLFERYGIHATWAAVGFLFFGTRESLTRGMPRRLPEYSPKTLSPYSRVNELGRDEAADPYHFAPSLLRAIQAAPHQEIGSHTFSHYYCLEKAQTAEAFREDLLAAVAAARQFGVTLRSLVFPRNQVNPAYLETCREAGIVAYRGTERSWLYQPRPRSAETRIRRLARLADSYFNLTGRHTYPLEGRAQGGVANVPSSRLLPRHLRALKWLEPLRARRICGGMTFAARQGQAFHLWMHPEELAEYPDETLGMMEKILAHYQSLRLDYGMRSLNMGEAAEQLLAAPENEPAQAFSALAWERT